MKETIFDREPELLRSALKEFTERSYEDASLNTILKNSGISKGVFYYHFDSKKTLYLRLLQSAENAKWSFIEGEAQKRSGSPGSGNIFDKIRYQARLGAEFALRYPGYHKLGRMFSKERGTPIYAEAMAGLGSAAEEKLFGMVDSALAGGDIKSSYTREFLTKTLRYLLTGFDEIFSSAEDSEPDRMLRNLDMLIEFIRDGIGK